jgi:hypothetical protein
MAQRKGYIPRNDAEFTDFFMNLHAYVLKKTKGSPPAWTHLPAEEMTALGNAQAAWVTAYAKMAQPHTPVETKEKNRVRKASEKTLREFVNRFLRYPPVTDEDRDYMGIPNPDTVRTHHDLPTEQVEFTFKIKTIREVEVHFKVAGAESKAKPVGYEGAVVIWEVLDKPPSGPEDLTKHKLASRTPYTIKFKEAERGKTVYVALAWQNGKAVVGDWSAVESTVVP